MCIRDRDKPWCSVDGILGQYTDWHDQTQWPQVPGEAAIPTKSAKKQGDPLQKTGIVGAFCKTYNIEQAIAVFLDDVYTPCVNGRYTYTCLLYTSVAHAALIKIVSTIKQI